MCAGVTTCGLLLVLIVLSLLMLTRGQELQLVYQVKEESPKGTVVASIADDLIGNLSFTAKELQNRRYSIFSKNDQMLKKFLIDESTGVIRTGMILDRENECEKRRCELSFDVGFYYTHPTSGHVSIGEKIIRIIIQLEDINDNAPLFPEKYIARNVSESVPIGHVIPVPSAIDDDTLGNHSVKMYLLFPNDGPFTLSITETPSGVDDIGIKVIKKLDREKRDFYRLTIIAKDGGYPRLSGSVDINITITDINDNTPQFNIRTFTILVREDIAVGSTILALSATDMDIGSNSQLTYRISPRASSKVKEMFMIQFDSGELYPIKRLDFETENRYQFAVEVRDNGNPELSSEASVVIEVSDVNDIAPQIVLKQKVFNLSEALKPGSAFTVFSIVDGDSQNGEDVSCFIPDPRFLVKKFQYNYRKIFLQHLLDYEKTTSIEVNITCRDSGTPPLSNTTSFTVQVQDVNDCAPIFPNSTIFAHITENNEIDDLVTILTATDADGPTNNAVWYGIVGESSMVSVNRYSGEMRAKQVFDSEVRSSFEVLVKAVDAKNPLLNSTAMVVVTIQDLNDMPPKFTQQQFHFNITENLPAYSVCGRVTAVDLDSSDNFVFIFRDVESVRNLFKIDSRTGELRTAQKLTREDNVLYNFVVIAMDPDNEQFRSSSEVTVYVMEDTDKPPIITFPNRMNNSLVITSNMDIGDVFGVIRAVDDGRDGQIMLTYTIEQGNEDILFSINALTGELTLARGVGSGDIGEHEILVAVHDNGVPRHTTYAYLTVNIAASNGVTGAGFDYLPIVISLVFLTIILGLSIFLGIMCMKKRDRKRKERQRKIEQGMKVYTLPRDKDPDSPRYTSTNALSKKPDAMARMQVFNDIERDSYKFNDCLETSFQSEEDDKISDLSHTRDFYIQGGTFDPGLGRKYTKYRHIPGFFPKMDDGASDVSMATDSGRGASDEDINSNRALFLHSEIVSYNSSLV